jgi:peroxiredoxin
MSNQMHRKTLIVLIGLFGLVVVAAVLVSAMGGTPKIAPKEGPRAMDFALKDLNGKTHTLSSYKGKFVFLNFWATWCPPCRKEMPSMQKVFEKSDKKKFVMLAVNAKEDKRAVLAFAKKNGYTFPILLDTDYKVSGQYQVQAIPLTLLIDKNGRIVGRICGAREWKWDQLKTLVQ